MRTYMHENPSADKFDPPPQPLEPDATGPRASRFVLALLILASYPALLWLESFRGRRGWTTGFAALGVFALSALHYVLHRKRADQREGTDPYTPPIHLTR